LAVGLDLAPLGGHVLGLARIVGLPQEAVAQRLRHAILLAILPVDIDMVGGVAVAREGVLVLRRIIIASGLAERVRALRRAFAATRAGIAASAGFIAADIAFRLAFAGAGRGLRCRLRAGRKRVRSVVDGHQDTPR